MKGGFSDLKRIFRRFLALPPAVEKLERNLSLVQAHLGVSRDLFDEYQRTRAGEEYNAVFDEPDPLVTVCVATYNRARLLTERCIPSILDQTHRNLELIVVGDCCIDDTPDRVAGIEDPRFCFINLPERGNYPEDPSRRWMVAGTVPLNHALSVARGHFVTHLDDDDAFLPDRLEKLLGCIREQRADLVFHPFSAQRGSGWEKIEALDFSRGNVTTSSILYHRWFCRIGWDLDAHLFGEPGDWHRLSKFRYLGARMVRCPHSLTRHFREENQKQP